MAVVKNLMVRAGADFSGMRQEMQRANKNLSDFKSGVSRTLKSVGIAFAGVFAAKKMIDFGTASVNAASQLESAMTGLRSTLEGQGRDFSKANTFIQGYIKDGLVPLMNAVTAYKNLASRGYSDDQIQGVMSRLKDSAAFGRQASLTLGDAVQTATEGLKDENSILVDNAGVTKNVAKMWEDYAKSIGKGAQQLTKQERIQAEFNGIMTETRFQVGDAAKYTQTYAGRVAALSKTLLDIKVNVGQALITIANIVLPILQTVANAFSRATAFAAQFMAALFGVSKDTQQTKAASTQADAVAGLGDAYEMAGKQAKGAVAGFDQVNLIGGSSGAAADTTGGIIPTDTSAQKGAFSDVSKKAQEMAAKVKEAFKDMSSFINQHKDLIVASLAGLGAGFTTFLIATNWAKIIGGIRTAFLLLGGSIEAVWAALTGPIGLIAIGVAALVGAFIYFYRTNEQFKGVVDGILQKIGDTAMWLWQSVLVPLGKFLADIFVQAWNGVTIAAEWLWKNVLVPLGSYMLWFMDNVIKPVGGALGNVLGAAFQAVADIAKAFWENVLIPLGNFFADVFGPTVEALSAVFTSLWDNVLKPLGSNVNDVLKPAWEGFSNVIVFLLDNVLKPVVEFVGGELSTIFTTVFSSIGEIINGLKTTLIGFMTYVTGVFTGDWGKAWEGVKDIFKGVFESLYALVKTPINLIIDAINAVISGLNKISIDIPEWVSTLAGVKGGKFGINIGQIPKLAVGALAFGPTLAMVGDNPGASSDPEVIAPLSMLGDYMAGSGDNAETVTVLRLILQAIKENRTVQAVIAASEVTRTAINGINDETRRTGRNPLTT